MLLVFYLLSFFLFFLLLVSGLFLYRLCIGIPSSTRALLF